LNFYILNFNRFFILIDTPTTTTTTTTRTTTVNIRGQYIQANTRLAGHYEEPKTSSTDECFEICDADESCAAACLTLPGQCRLFRFGFETIGNTSESTAYVKPEVAADMANMSSLINKFPTVKMRTKILNFYHRFSAMTPSRCFNACKQSASCGGASFSGKPADSFNCYLCRAEHATDASRVVAEGNSLKVNTDMWTAYFKEAS
jgi:hypothetical protein